MKPRVLIFSGYGLNCEEETKIAFTLAGCKVDIVHINDLIANKKLLKKYQILAFPGGFSYGDDTGSGNAYAQKVRATLWEQLSKFIAEDKLIIGICNGCQILVNLGLVPALDNQYGTRTIAMDHNASARYQCRWVDVAVPQHHKSIWLNGIERLHIPIAHGEGRFVMDADTLHTLKHNRQIALQYIHPDGKIADGHFPTNPNGAMDDIAGITDPTGRVLALMPHPERGMFLHQRDDFTLLKEHFVRSGEEIPVESDGIKIFRNAANYFSST